MLRIMRKHEGCLLISSTTQTVQISSLVGTRVCLISGVGCFELQRWPRWVIGERLGIGRSLDSGKMFV
jgi:hypothetical protein